MKRALKISAFVLGVILTAIITLCVVLMSPAVQTALTRRVLASLQQKMDGRIEFSSLTVRPFDAVVIEDLAFIDDNPYRNPNLPELTVADTIVKAKNVSVSFNAWGLLTGKPAMVKDLRIKDGQFFLVNEPDGSNLKRFFSKNKPKQKKEPKKIPDIELMRADYVCIDGFRFRMINHKNPKPHRDRAMNWTDLDLYDIHMTVRDVTLKGIITEGTVEHLEAKEKSGFVLHHMSGRARVYNRQTAIENLEIRDMFSDIHMPHFKMNYDGIPALNHFLEEVRLQAEIVNSRINMETIAYFAPTLHRMDFVGIIEKGDIDGFVNDLSIDKFTFRTADNSLAAKEIKGSIIGLPSTLAMTTNYDIKDMTFTPEGLDKFIKGWAPNLKFDVSRMLPKERMTFNGKIRGPLNNAKVTGALSSVNSGSLNMNLQFSHLLEGGANIGIGGRVETHEFDAGALAGGTKALGPCTMHGSFRTTIGKKISVKLDSLKIDHLRAMDYDYRDLVAAGTYTGDAFDGTIFCNDPNLNFMFNGLFTLSNKTGDGVYKFVANLAYANLNALHIDNRGRSELSMNTNANFRLRQGGDLLGNIRISNIVLTDDDGRSNIGDIDINSYMNGDVNKINLDSKFATLRYSGTGFIDDFIKDITSLACASELSALFSGEAKDWSGNTYALNLSTRDTKDILSFVAPGVWVADGTKFDLNINKEGELIGKLTSGRLAINDKYLKDVDLSIRNNGNHLEADILADDIKISAIRAFENKIKLLADDNTLDICYSYDNKSMQDNKGTINLTGDLYRGDDNQLGIIATLLPSQIYMNSVIWNLESAPISISSMGTTTDNITAKSAEQSLVIKGGISTKVADTLTFDMHNFEMAALNPFLPANIQLGGRSTGHASILSPINGAPYILANLDIRNAMLGDEPLGDIAIESMWDNERKGYKAICSTWADGKNTMDIKGFISPSDKSVAASVGFNNYDLGDFSPLLASVFSQFDGRLNGNAYLKGKFGGDLNLTGKDLRIDDGLIRVAFTNVLYKLNGELGLSTDGVNFMNVKVQDETGAKGTVGGGISWKKFSDIAMNIDMSIDKMLVLDMKEGMGQNFYGKIAATGKASLYGPLESLMLKAEASTVGNGDLHIPMNSSAGMARNDLLVFKEPEPEEKPDQYEEMLRRNAAKQKKVTSFATDIDVFAHPGIEAVIEVDKASGNVLSGRGQGRIQLKVKPADGSLSLGGNYTITDGTYHFAALGIAKRDFSINEGGTVKFVGDVMETDLNIRAEYKTKTSLATLLADSTSTSSRRLVICGINITNKIKSPRIEFTIDIPDIDATTQARVQSALNTDDKLQKQFLSLLISGGFLPDESSGIVNNSSMLGSTVADLMASQLSNVLQKLNIPIDLGLDYQKNSSGADIFEVAVSTQLFNNRISINGTFGNRANSVTSQQEVLGDLEVEFKLTKNGSIRATAFHRTADQYTNYLDNLKRNGVGLSFQTEFDTFGELIRNLFPWLVKSAIKNEDIMLEDDDDDDKVIIFIDEEEEEDED